MNFSIIRFDAIDSTNTEALRQARLGAAEGLCVIARQQTAGRGRQGRSWTSPNDAGLYLSVLLWPTIEARFMPLITLTAAVAVYDTLADFGLKPDIKWPNDVLVNEKKICGILAEMAETAFGLAVVLGIGVNITSESFSQAIADTATAVSAELGHSISASEIEKSVLSSVDRWYFQLREPDGHFLIINAWAARSTYFRGKSVRVSLSDGVISGVTDGLESNGALRIKQPDGSVIVIQAGDIERLRQVF